MLKRTIFILLACLLPAAFAFAGVEDKDCLACHGVQGRKVAGFKNPAPFVDKAKFTGSVHGGNGCVSCHSAARTTPRSVCATACFTSSIIWRIIS